MGEKQQKSNRTAKAVKKKKDKAKHLTKYKWKKGQSGNPKGRPKDSKIMADQLEKLLGKQCPIIIGKGTKSLNMTWLETLVFATAQLATKGNATALKEVWNRIDGKVPIVVQSNEGTDAARALDEIMSYEEFRKDIESNGEEE